MRTGERTTVVCARVRMNVCFCINQSVPHLSLSPYSSPPAEPSNIEGNAESARVVGLLPWMDYEFQVIASNILGSGEPSMSSHTVRTQQAAPTVAPSGLGGGGGDRNELIITWTVSVSVCVCVRMPECVCVCAI